MVDDGGGGRCVCVKRDYICFKFFDGECVGTYTILGFWVEILIKFVCECVICVFWFFFFMCFVFF